MAQTDAIEEALRAYRETARLKWWQRLLRWLRS